MSVPTPNLGGVSTVWLSFVGALATLLAARLREKGAKREEWWRRVQWAADLALGEDVPRQTAGLGMLGKLAHSPLATDADTPTLTRSCWAFSPVLSSMPLTPLTHCRTPTPRGRI